MNTHLPKLLGPVQYNPQMNIGEFVMYFTVLCSAHHLFFAASSGLDGIFLSSDTEAFRRRVQRQKRLQCSTKSAHD